MRTQALFLLVAFAVQGAGNTLTPEERRAGWKLLFDGRTFRNWRDPAKKNLPGDAWTIEGGCLKTPLQPRISEDLITEESFGDFELQFDWRVSPGANSGVKYRIQSVLFVDETKIQPGRGGFEGSLGRELSNARSDRAKMAAGAKGFAYTIGFEFQLLDDAKNADAKAGASHRTGALYSMIPPTAQTARPAGEWNQSRLVVRGNQVEHWINGTKVLEGALDADAVITAVNKRWGPAPPIRDMLAHPKPQGPIGLQHHGDEVWFRNIKVRRLDHAPRP